MKTEEKYGDINKEPQLSKATRSKRTLGHVIKYRTAGWEQESRDTERDCNVPESHIHSQKDALFYAK